MADHPESLLVQPLPGYDPYIGRLLWMLQAGRARLLEALAPITPAAEPAILNPPLQPGANTVASLLYHIAAIEADWLFEEILADYQPAQPIAWPDALLPYPVRDHAGQLTTPAAESLAAHLHRLDGVRQLLLTAFLGMTPAELRRPRRLPGYHVTPEWVLFHLMQHEAEHRGQIRERLSGPE
jgi:uncharacterized damage-inducible protein DinB